MVGLGYVSKCVENLSFDSKLVGVRLHARSTQALEIESHKSHLSACVILS